MPDIINVFAATECQKDFLGFPTWYSYLKPVPPDCVPVINSLTDIWLIVLSITEILLRLSSLVAIVFVIYGGIMFITSQGNSESTSKARSTIINSLIGLGIAVTASVLISFIAGSIK